MDASPADGPLTGITVLELGQVIAGTYAGLLLADMGAEVIKIEPLSGDTARNPGIAPFKGQSSIHLFMNRGKKSVALDLKQPEGRALFYRLVEQADAVVDNFRPGVLQRLGIDRSVLQAHNPAVITTSVTGFGPTGPASRSAAFDLVVQARSGHLAITGDPAGGPARVGIPLADVMAGIFSCVAVLGALVGRERGGPGRHADIGMLDSLVSILGYDALHHLNTGEDVGRYGTAHAHIVPWQAFEVRDGYVAVAARDEKFWRNLCDVIGRGDLKDDPRTRDNQARVANRDYVVEVLGEAFRARTRTEWMALLDAADIPAAPVNSVGEVFADPQVIHRHLVGTYQHPVIGPVQYPVSPLRYSAGRPTHAPAPMLGQHTVEVLTGRLGCDRDQLRRLEEQRCIQAWSGGGEEQPA